MLQIKYYSDLCRFVAGLTVPEDGSQYRENDKQHQQCNKPHKNT